MNEIDAMSPNLKKPPLNAMRVYAYDITAALMKFADASGAFACMDEEGKVQVRELSVDHLDRCVARFRSEWTLLSRLAAVRLAVCSSLARRSSW